MLKNKAESVGNAKKTVYMTKPGSKNNHRCLFLEIFLNEKRGKENEGVLFVPPNLDQHRPNRPMGDIVPAGNSLESFEWTAEPNPIEENDIWPLPKVNTYPFLVRVYKWDFV